MINKLRIYFKFLLKVFRYRKLFIYKVRQKVKSYEMLLRFYNKYNYLPEGLFVSDIEALHLSPSSIVGPDNTIFVTRKNTNHDKKPLIYFGRNTWTRKNVELNVLDNNSIIIEDYSTIQDNCKLIGDVTIERYCLLAPAVFLSSGNHYATKDVYDIIRNQDKNALSNPASFDRHSKRIYIEEDCWLGYSSFVKAGVYIGRGSIIGANSIATSDIMPYSIIGGANKILGKRLEFTPPLKIDAANRTDMPYFYRGFAFLNEEKRAIGFSGYMELVRNKSIFMLKKHEWNTINITGEIICFNEEVIEYTIHFGGYLFSSKILAKKMGNFSLVIDSNLLITKSDINEPSFKMADHYNVFLFLYKSKFKETVVLIKYIEEL